MENQIFKDLYKNLNKAQKTAVDAVEGAVMVVAGPGTGKTQVLTLRIANILLKTQINPENILALTFTESAAYEMRKRLLSIIGQDAYRVEITTFHSFCNNFIKNHKEEFSHIIASASINEIEQLQIIENCINSLSLKILRPLGDISYYLKPILATISELKRENVTPDLFKKALKIYKTNLDSNPDLYHEKGAYKGKMKADYQKAYKDLEKNEELLLVFSEYQKKLIEEKKYDYNDMLLEVIKKLNEHPYLLQFLQEKFQYFLVDEHQDTNAAQNKIIEFLCSYFDNPNLFVVGDEKQAIFRFQGATLENFIYFKNKYPDAVLINLSDNYRSTQMILDAAYAIIKNNPKSTKILSESGGLTKRSLHKEEFIEIAALDSEDSEYFWIGEKIKKLLETIPGHEIAVLTRNNNDIDPLISVFDSLKISYIIESDSNILEDLDVQKLIILFRVVTESLKNRDEYVKKAMLFDCFNISPISVFKLIRTSYEERRSLWDLVKDEKIQKELEIKDKKEINDFFDFFADKEKGLIKKASNKRFDEVFVDALNGSEMLKKILGKPHSQEILGRFSRLYDEVKKEVGKNPSYSILDFLKYIDLLEENKISIKQNVRIIQENFVRVMTVHKSKGLEFDLVFVINAYDGHWGNSKRKGSSFKIPWEDLDLKVNSNIDDENVDERRLFYVALTRARKKVFLSYPLVSKDGREYIPSQFISEIPEQYVKGIDVLIFQRDFLKHQDKLFISANTASDNWLNSKDYIAEIFKRQGMSVSALNNYLECPWKYFFLNLIRVPEAINDSGLFGNAIHAALNSYLIALKKGKANKNFLLQVFREELNQQPISVGNFDNFLERGEKALEGFYKERISKWNKNQESELEIRGIRINDDIILNGKIDMINPKITGKVDVYDFKTGKYKSRNHIEGLTKNSDGNYKRQLVFYKILLDRYKNNFYKMENGIIEFVEPTDTGLFKNEVFSISDKEASELLKQVINVGNEIISFSFWNKTCEEKNCKFCLLRKYMDTSNR